MPPPNPVDALLEKMGLFREPKHTKAVVGFTSTPNGLCAGRMVVMTEGGTSTYSTTASTEELCHMMTSLGVDTTQMTLFDDRYVVKDAVDKLKTFGTFIDTFGPSKELLIDPDAAFRMRSLRDRGNEDLIVTKCPISYEPTLLMLFPNNGQVERCALSLLGPGIHCDLTFMCKADDAPTPREGRLIEILDAMSQYEVRVAPGAAAAAFYESFE